MKTPYAAILLLHLLILGACSAPKRGCADFRAVNFSFDADEPCAGTANTGDCPCVYPKLKVLPSAEFAKNTASGDSIIKWRAESPLQNNAGQAYFLKRFSFFISNIRLTDDKGAVFSIADSLSIPIKSSSTDSGFVTIRSNPVLLGESSGTIEAGTFLYAGRFKQLNFTFGLKSPENSTNITNVKMPVHPLNTDSMYLRNEYRLICGKFFYQTSDGKSGIVQVKDSREVSVSMPTDLYFTPATDLILKLKIDFRKFFESVNFLTHSSSDMEAAVLQNLNAVFSVSK